MREKRKVFLGEAKREAKAVKDLRGGIGGF